MEMLKCSSVEGHGGYVRTMVPVEDNDFAISFKYDTLPSSRTFQRWGQSYCPSILKSCHELQTSSVFAWWAHEPVCRPGEFHFQ